jgi:hypothetical protein
MQTLHMICIRDDLPGSEAAVSDDESLLPFADMLSSFTNLTLLKWQHHPRREARCAYAPVLAESLRQLTSLQDLQIDAGVYTPLRVPMPPTVVVVVAAVAAAVVLVVLLAVARSLPFASWSCYGCLYVHARHGPLSKPATCHRLHSSQNLPQTATQHSMALRERGSLNKSQCVRLH